MSLFKGTEWWTVTAGNGLEDFNAESLCLGDCDNQGNGDKIIVGSLKGLLRIYHPVPTTAFSPDNLVLEKDLQEPILQVKCGQFLMKDKGKLIAVLHPKLLTVYRLVTKHAATATEDQTDVVGSYTLEKVFGYKMRHTACHMCAATFGSKAVTLEHICVLSLDGVVSVYEGGIASYSCYLPEFILPGPITYSNQLDAIVTASTARKVECFRYEAIVRTATSGHALSNSQQSTEKVNPVWSVDLGEHILDIREVIISPDVQKKLGFRPPSISSDDDDGEHDGSCLMVLGERNLFCLELTGEIRFVKKLDTPPTCFSPYTVKLAACSVDPQCQEVNVMTLVAFDNCHSLMVLSNTRLAWAATLSAMAPIAIAVANFEKKDVESRGMIVALEDGGRLSCSYLGTEAPISLPFAGLSRRDGQVLSADIKDVKARIQKAQAGADDDQAEHCLASKQVITLTSAKPPRDLLPAFDEAEWQTARECVRLTFTLTAPATGGVRDVAVTVRCDSPVVVDPPGIVLSQISAGSPSDLEFSFFVAAPTRVANATATIVASYTSAENYPQSQVHDIRLPFGLFATATTPDKDAKYKVTITSSKQCVNLNQLFGEIVAEESARNSVAFRLSCGSTVSVLSARNTKRYRIQSAVFTALWLVMDELCQRLTAYHTKNRTDDDDDDGTPVVLSVTHALPLEQYYSLIDTHFEKRVAIASCMARLEQRAVEYRMLQKRLLMRVKEKSSKSLNHLDLLLGRSYDLITELCDEEEALRVDLHQASVELSAGTRVMHILLRLWLQLTDDMLFLVENVISATVNEPPERHGWEEVTDKSLLHMLKTTFAKNEDEREVYLESEFTMPTSTIDLKKHLALLIARLSEETDSATSQSGGARPAPAHGESSLPGDRELPSKPAAQQPVPAHASGVQGIPPTADSPDADTEQGVPENEASAAAEADE